MSKRTKPSVGGQALIEGVMMRGTKKAAMAVRMSSGDIDIEEWDIPKPSIVSKIPVVRGMVNFISMMSEGYKCLAKSAEKSGMADEAVDEEPSKLEKWINDKLGDKITTIIVGIGIVLGVAFAVGLFMLLPSIIVKGIDYLLPLGGFKALTEGIIKIVIFIVYLSLVSMMPDIKRVFEYHGAEHKTIFCYEAGLPFTVENVKRQSRFHPRCGTSFLIIMLIFSILIFSLPIVPWDNVLIRLVMKLLLLPLVLGVAYEFIKLAGKYTNWFTKAISWPGIQVQRLTTREPDDEQIEIAVAAVLPCLTEQEREFYAVKAPQADIGSEVCDDTQDNMNNADGEKHDS